MNTSNISVSSSASAREEEESAGERATLSDFDDAKLCLASLRATVDQALAHLKKQCTVEGTLAAKKLDECQQASYEIAFCVADLEASGAMLSYALAIETGGVTEAQKEDQKEGQKDDQKDDQVDELCRPLALSFCAENIKSVWHRLFSHAGELGLPTEQLIALIETEKVARFIADHGNVSQLQAIGKTVLQRAAQSSGSRVRLPAGLGQEKTMVQLSFARFADEVVMPQAEHIHRNDTDIPDALITAAAEMGCFGSCIPERFGGLMPDDRNDSLGMLLVTEELSRGSLGAAGSLITRPEIAARALLQGGTDEQKAHYLPKFAAGELLAAISITEPDYGSDVASLTLKATRPKNRDGDGDGDGWILDGAKTWCTFAGKADVIVVIARTDPDKSKGHRGLSMFLVDKPRFDGHQFSHQSANGGSLTGKAIPTIGYRGMHSFDLAFDNFFVPDTALVGGPDGEGKGFYLTMAGLSGGRIQTAARASGVMQAAIDCATSYASDRKVFGAAIGDYQLTQVKLARMLAAVTASRQFSYSVARLMDDGGGKMEASLVKLYACRAAEWVTREALQIHGGMGYAEETSVSRYFVDARVLSIFEGAEETLALKVIARELIGNAR